MELNTTAPTLAERWRSYRSERPHARIRNAAADLGVSEYELLCTGETAKVTALQPDFAGIFSRLHELGNVMGLTRNEAAVHERKGVYTNFSKAGPAMGLVVNPDIDLRVFFEPWRYGLAVEEEGGKLSLQFFAAWGEAIHKIFLNGKSDADAFHRLVADFATSEAGEPELLVKPEGEQRSTLSDTDREAFRDGWVNLRDTHDFYGLYRKYKLSRLQSIEEAPTALAPDGMPFVREVDHGIIERMLMGAAATELPIMVFIGNAGMIQIHTGAIKNLLWHERWYNIMDKEFQMHLNMDRVARVFIVRKPTIDGMVQSIEVFDHDETLIVQFFGARKPGKPELDGWIKLITHELTA